jgi:ribbon-helix-helix protein
MRWLIDGGALSQCFRQAGWLTKHQPWKGRWTHEINCLKRSIVLAGRKTSISPEEPFWKALKDIASRRRQTLSALVGGIDT